MFLHRQSITTAMSTSRKPLPQDAPPMRAPAKPALPPCRRSPRWPLSVVGSPWAAVIGPSFVPA